MSFPYLPTGFLTYLTVAAPYVALGAIVFALIAIIAAWRAHARLRKMTFERGKSLEDTLGELTRRVKELQVFREELEGYLKNSEARLQTSVRGMGIVRFNPFQGDGSGGNQSFALALLNEQGDGVTISTLYTRGGQTSVYAKPVEKGQPQFELSEEEQEALHLAAEGLKKRSLPQKPAPKAKE